MTELQLDVLKHITSNPGVQMSHLAQVFGSETHRVVMGLAAQRHVQKTQLGLYVTPKGAGVLWNHCCERAASLAAPQAVRKESKTPSTEAENHEGKEDDAFQGLPVVIGGQRRWLKPYHITGESQTQAGTVRTFQHSSA